MQNLRALASILALFAVVATSACAAPLQNGGVDVRPGAEDRLDLLCRYREGSADAQRVCAVPEGAEE
jgi:hypothetical protein